VIVGFLFGVTVAAAIGPIALLIINTSARFGLNAGVRSGLGAAVADLIYAAGASFAGAGIVRLIAEHARELRILASVVLILVGPWLLRSVFRAGQAAERTPQSERPFLTTLALTIVNPLTLIIFASFVMQSETRAPADVIAVIVGIFLGSLAVQMALALGGAGLGRLFSDPRATRLINVASGAGIAVFGIVGLMTL
jgi:threonine/homoserine/homoserine lactone efflux protein